MNFKSSSWSWICLFLFILSKNLNFIIPGHKIGLFCHILSVDLSSFLRVILFSIPSLSVSVVINTFWRSTGERNSVLLQVFEVITIRLRDVKCYFVLSSRLIIIFFFIVATAASQNFGFFWTECNRWVISKSEITRNFLDTSCLIHELHTVWCFWAESVISCYYNIVLLWIRIDINFV